MSTPYYVIYDNALSKLKLYEWYRLNKDEIYAILFDYLRPAIAEFVTCRKDLGLRDDVLGEFNVNLNDTEIEILSNYMVIKILDSNYIRISTLLKQALPPKNYNAFSQANHINSLLSIKNSYISENETLISRYNWIKKEV